MRMLTEGIEGGEEGGEGQDPNSQYIQITPEENESITRVLFLKYFKLITCSLFHLDLKEIARLKRILHVTRMKNLQQIICLKMVARVLINGNDQW